jgi:hypothetical protein
MVADPWLLSPMAGFHHDEVEAHRQSGQVLPLEQAVGCLTDAHPLAVVDRFLWQAEIPAAAPADLDDHERDRRTRVGRHDVEFSAADMDVPGQDGPSDRREMRGDQRFGGIARLLGRGPHRVDRIETVHAPKRRTGPSPEGRGGLHRDLSTAHLEERQILSIERRVVCHDRDEFTLEQRVGHG